MTYPPPRRRARTVALVVVALVVPWLPAVAVVGLVARALDRLVQSE